MKKTKRLKEIEKELKPIHAKSNKLEAEASNIRDTIKRIRNNNLVGNCYKTQNFYSRPECWILYVKVIGVNKQGDLQVVTAEKTSHGNIEIGTTTRYDLPGDYMRINPDVFKRALYRLLKEIQK